MKNSNCNLCKVINYEFNDCSILDEALTHPSMNKKSNDGQIVNYERLEFLEDSVLNTIVSSLLFKQFPNENEGALAKRKKFLVCRNTIVSVTLQLQLDDFIIVNKGYNGGKCSDKNLENV